MSKEINPETFSYFIRVDPEKALRLFLAALSTMKWHKSKTAKKLGVTLQRFLHWERLLDAHDAVRREIKNAKARGEYDTGKRGRPRVRPLVKKSRAAVGARKRRSIR